MRGRLWTCRHRKERRGHGRGPLGSPGVDQRRSAAAGSLPSRRGQNERRALGGAEAVRGARGPGCSAEAEEEEELGRGFSGTRFGARPAPPRLVTGRTSTASPAEPAEPGVVPVSQPPEPRSPRDAVACPPRQWPNQRAGRRTGRTARGSSQTSGGLSVLRARSARGKKTAGGPGAQGLGF